jgi:hypothetical protein
MTNGKSFKVVGSGQSPFLPKETEKIVDFRVCDDIRVDKQFKCYPSS